MSFIGEFFVLQYGTEIRFGGNDIMSDIFIEVLVKRNRKSTDLLMKTLLIGLVVVLFVGGFLFIPLLLPLGLVLGLVEWFFILPRFDVEYEYSFVNGEIDIDAIYSKEKRKHLDTVEVDTFECVAPYGSHELDRFQHDFTVADYSALDPDRKPYVCVQAGEKRLVYLQLEDKTLKDAIKNRIPRKFFDY